MAKSMVEKYEQILSADPGSMVFVELAKALLDRGDARRAIDVCEAGLQHHPESVVGRVLWGKALISQGKPAEAMQQFDEAIAIDRENPYAYNLIGEVLLHKGLHRSALPILKKAVALQPNDMRVRQWLEQTTRALNGEKPSAAPQYTNVDVLAPVPAAAVGLRELTGPGAPAYAGEGPAPTEKGGSDEVLRGMTDVFQSLASREERPAGRATTSPKESLAALQAVVAAAPSVAPAPPAPVNTPAGRPGFAGTMPYGKAPRDLAPLGEIETTNPYGKPSPAVARPVEAPEVTAPGHADPPLPPLTELAEPPLGERTVKVNALVEAPVRAAEATRDARELSPSALAPPAPADVLARDPNATVAPPEHPDGEPVRMTRAAEDEAPLPPELVAATLSTAEARPDHTFPGPPPPAPVSARAPDDTLDLPPAPAATPVLPPASAPPPMPAGPPPLKSSPRMPAAGGPPPLKSSPKMQAAPSVVSGLLADLPISPATPSMELPKVELSTQAAEAIAKEYERELREKLAAAANQPKSFWARNGLKLGAGVLALALCGVAFGVYRYAKRSHTNLPELMSQAHAGIEKDTQSSYQAALAALSDLLEVSPDNAEAHALAAYAHAVLYREHGEQPSERDAAMSELSRPEVEQLYPELAAAARYYLADSAEAQKAAAKPLLTGKTAEAHELAGKLLLESDPRKALEQFQESLKAQSGHVRTYVALADYYLDNGEPGVAQSMLTQAKTLSDHHPLVLIGLANARLAQSKELDEAAQDLAVVEKEADKLDPDTRARLDLATGRLLAAQGHADEGLKRLEEGLARAPSKALEFHQAMADAHELEGSYDKALAELAAAQRSRPGAERDLNLVDEMARAQIALGHPAEALRLTEKLDDRRIHLTRGIAHYEQGAYEAARRELLLTRREKTMPTEAAIYLARSEIAAGHKEDAKPAIDAIVAAGKLSPKAQVARGELALASGDVAGAKTAFAAAAEDAREYEAPYLLGKVLLGEGKLADAQKPLQTAVDRNHAFGEAHRALGRLLLAEGDAKGARQHLSLYLKEHKDDAVALAGLARANLMVGDVADARAFARQASERTGRDPEVIWTRTQVDLAAGDGSLVLRELEKRAKALRSAEALCDLGDAALDVDDAKDALGAYARALKIERTLPRARVGEAVATASLKGKAALKDLNDLAAEKGKLPPVQLARVLAMLSRLSAPADQPAKAQEAVAASDLSAPAHLALGLALGKAPEALPELSRAVALEPALAEAHLALADALLASGEKPRAIAEAEVAARIAQRGPVADRARRISGEGPAMPPPRGKLAHGGRGKKHRAK